MSIKQDSNNNTGKAGLKCKNSCILFPLFIVILACAAYSNSFAVPFHYDDDVHITENHYIRMTELNWDRIKTAAVQDKKQNRPLSNLSFAFNYYFFGDDPWSYHLVNLILHCFCAVLLFFLIDRTLQLGGYPRDLSPPASFGAASIWAVHPINTQAVTYIVQRQTVMASVFLVASLLCYIYARTAGSSGKKYTLYILSVISFLVAAGSKEISLVLPFIVLIYEIFFFQKFSLSFLQRRWYITTIIILALFGMLAFMLRPEMLLKITSGYSAYEFGMKERLLTEARVVFYYIGLVFLPLPSRLSLEHDYVLSTGLFQPWTTALAILIIACALCWAVFKAKSHPLASLAVLWYFGNLFIESSFIPLDLVIEHRLYLASISIIAPLAALAVFPGRRKIIIGIIYAVVLMLLIAGAISRNQVWKDPHALWLEAARKAPSKARPWNNLCGMEIKNRNYAQAVKWCDKALSLSPNVANIHNNLGIAYYNMDMLEEARKEFMKAVDLNPSYTVAHFNLAEYYRLKGNTDKAVEEYGKTISIDPSYIPARLNLAHLYYNMGELDNAISEYRMVIEYNPKLPQAYLFLARSLCRGGHYESCAEAADNGIKLEPAVIELYMLKAGALLEIGNFKESWAAYVKILKIEPKNQDAILGMALIDIIDGRLAQAEDKIYHVRFFNPGHPRLPEIERMLEKALEMEKTGGSDNQDTE